MSQSSPQTAAFQAGSTAEVAAAARPRWSRRVAADMVGLLDVAAVVVGATVPAAIYAQAGGLQAQWPTILQAALVTSFIVYGCLRNWNMYDTTRMHDFPTSPGRLLGALVLAALAVLGLGLPFASGDVHLWVWYGTWISASFTLILGNRIVSKIVLASLTAAGRFDTRVAVFGAGPIARRVHDYLKSDALGIHFVGVFDDRLGTDRINPDGLTIDGKLEELLALGRQGGVDQIIIALPQSADRRISLIARKLEQLPVSVHIVTHIASDLVEAGPAHQLSALGSVGLIDVKGKPLADWAPLVKRAEDYVIGSFLLFVTLPLFALIALAIKLESKGPVLFRQRRRGLNQAEIGVYKFRTMRVLEDGSKIEQATRNDPRVTVIGRILRRTSLDELPQLINVLKGEMSLVGPRPHAVAHDDQWGSTVELYAHRHQVRPGITGLAQVNGWRGETTTTDKVEGRVEQDLAYIRNWSLWLDIKILCRTIAAVLFPRNAH